MPPMATNAPRVPNLRSPKISARFTTFGPGITWLIAHGGYGPLNWCGLAWLLVAIALSLWAGRRVAVPA
jgi:hypothetical protein